jgi:hypothetical protein
MILIYAHIERFTTILKIYAIPSRKYQ